MVTDVSVEAVAKNCTSLTTIYLDRCGKVTDAGIEALAHSCPSEQCRLGQVRQGHAMMPTEAVLCCNSDALVCTGEPDLAM